MPLSSSLRPSRLFFILLVGLLAVLWVAGGASRGDVIGQAVVRGMSWLVVGAAVLFADRPFWKRPHVVLLLLLCALTLALVQLVPLPPGIWQMLPGHRIVADAVSLSHQDQPWRPWSIVPDATINAAASLIVPLATGMLVSGLAPRERSRLPGLVLGLIVASAFVGLLQFSGVTFNNPFINETLGEVGGTFANRNHFALFLALGCVVAPVWGFISEAQAHWRAPTAWGLVLLFLLTILATGSRAGLGLGVMALLISLLLSRRPMQRALARYPRWVLPALVGGIIAMVAIFVLISVMADRAVSINRLFAVDQGQDMRTRGLPSVLEAIRIYFPFGAGFGSFDPIFRMHEPFELLKLSYFNHAHNDFLEVLLDAGLPGLLLLLAALAWWARESMRAWRTGSGRRHTMPKLGSAMLFLVVVASMFDYPARTPMIMAIMVIAGMWLKSDPEDFQASTLPRKGQHL